jgi:ribosomal protein S18 acetylase RimI-like enzyme
MGALELRARMASWLTEAGYRAVIFSQDGDFVAYALYRPDEPDEIYVRQLVVAPAYRRRGLGKRCVQLLTEHYWPAKARLVVDVLSGNAAGLAFWRSTGFADYFVRLERLHEAK